MAGMAKNGWKWLEIAEMAGNELQRLKMAGNGWKWLEKAGIGWKWLELKWN